MKPNIASPNHYAFDSAHEMNGGNPDIDTDSTVASGWTWTDNNCSDRINSNNTQRKKSQQRRLKQERLILQDRHRRQTMTFWHLEWHQYKLQTANRHSSVHAPLPLPITRLTRQVVLSAGVLRLMLLKTPVPQQLFQRSTWWHVIMDLFGWTLMEINLLHSR